jgi:hypothetical protein
MAIAYCFVAITSGALSALLLWPLIGALSLLAAIFISNLAGIALVVVLASKAGMRPREDTTRSEQQPWSTYRTRPWQPSASLISSLRGSLRRLFVVTPSLSDGLVDPTHKDCL